VTPALTTQEAWRQQFFGSWQNAGNAADAADPDGDGLPNGLEYGVGSRPGLNTPAAGPQSTIATDRLRLTFPRNQAATDLTYIVEGSANLSAWSTLATRTGAAAWSALNGGTVTETNGVAVVTDGVALAPGSKRFMRLRVTPDGLVYQTTVPEGAINLRLQQGTTSAVGTPLLNTPVYRGVTAGVSANTMTATGAAWSVNQFAQAGAPHFVAILSGVQTGRFALITANQASALTLQVDDTTLDAAGFSMAAGDRFEIFPGETLASMFGDLTSGLALQGGGPFTADTVQIHNGIRYVAYYFDTAKGFWARLGGDGTAQNDLALMPDRGLLMTRRGPTSSVVLTGRVPATSLLTRLPGGTTNAIATRFPVDTTLAQWTYSGPGAWIAHDSSFSADNINLFNGIRWTAYWRRATDGQWRQLNGDSSDQGGLVIPAGSSVLIQKRGTVTGAAGFFSQSLPYVLEPWFMNIKTCFFCAALMFAIGVSASAATRTWDGQASDGNFAPPLNWDGNISVPASGDLLQVGPNLGTNSTLAFNTPAGLFDAPRFTFLDTLTTPYTITAATFSDSLNRTGTGVTLSNLSSARQTFQVITISLAASQTWNGGTADCASRRSTWAWTIR
jgi:uncharacterized protein (TIGR02597 family)